LPDLRTLIADLGTDLGVAVIDRCTERFVNARAFALRPLALGIHRVRFQRSAFRAAIRRDGHAILVAKESLPKRRMRAGNPEFRAHLSIGDVAIFHSGLALRAIHFLLPLTNHVSFGAKR
jgi:hypothetical protein